MTPTNHLHRLTTLAAILLLACTSPPTEPTDTEPVNPCEEGFIEDEDGSCIAEACGLGTWGNLPVDGDTVYVNVEAEPDGDGSESAPLTSIQAGLDAAGDAGSSLVAVAAGTYSEKLSLIKKHDGVHLAGRCKQLVKLNPNLGDPLLAGIRVNAKGGSVRLSGITVRKSNYVGVMVLSGKATMTDCTISKSASVGAAAFKDSMKPSELTLERCVLKENASFGVMTYWDGLVHLIDSTVSESQPDKGDYGWGVNVHSGGLVRLTRSIVTNNTGAGVRTDGVGSSVTVEDSTIEYTLPEAKSGLQGFGIYAFEGASVSVSDSLIQHNKRHGIFADLPGTSIELTNVTIQNTEGDSEAESGSGIRITGGATLNATDSLFTGNVSGGLEVNYGGTATLESCEFVENEKMGGFAMGAGTRLSLNNTVIRDTRVQVDATTEEGFFTGYGLLAQDGGSIEATNSTITGNTTIGVLAYSPNTVVTLDNTTVSHTLPDEKMMQGGPGVSSQNGAELVLMNSIVSDNIGVNAYARDGARIVLDNTTLENGLADANGREGTGLYVTHGSYGEVTNSTIRNNTTGVLVDGDGSHLVINASSIQETRFPIDDPDSITVSTPIVAQMYGSIDAVDLVVSNNEGPGLIVMTGGSMSCERCTLQDNTFAGAVVVEGASLQINDSVIEDTLASPNLGGGFGIHAENDVAEIELTITNTLVRNNPLAGLWISGTGRYEITNNTISGGEGLTRANHSWCGDAVYVQNHVAAWEIDNPLVNNGIGLLLEGNEIKDGRGAGLFLDNSTATLNGNTYNNNPIDILSQGTNCEEPIEGIDTESVTTQEFCPLYDYNTCDNDNFTLYLTVSAPQASGH